MDQHNLEKMLADIHKVKIAVYGDFCLDAYWILDPSGGEISVETGLRTEAVKKQYYSLGGASNVVANLAALKPGSIQLAGVVGDDIFGREMVQLFQQLGVDTNRLITQKEDYDTVVFAKRYLNDKEQPRIDFGFFNERTEQTDDAIIKNLRDLLPTCDALIFNQQVPGSISASFIEKANALFQEFNDKIVVLDSRHFGQQFKNIYRKTNDIEASELLNISKTDETLTPEQLKDMSTQLFEQFHKPVFLTLGKNGILTTDEKNIKHTPGLLFDSQLDTVGAGDTVISALAAALGAGYAPNIAANFANLAAGVTVQKLLQTGTASGQEIFALNEKAQYGDSLVS
jgi:rfaE bifunctional protein kinase chain/domain